MMKRVDTTSGSNGVTATGGVEPRPQVGLPPSIMPDPTADPATALMLLMVKLHAQQREAGRSTELDAAKAEADADAKRIGEMRDRAGDVLAEGIAGGALGIASAGVSVASTLASSQGRLTELDGQEKQLESRAAAGAGASDTVAGNDAAAQCEHAVVLQRTGSFLGTTASAIIVTRDAVTAFYRAAEADHDASAAAFESDAHRSGREVDRAREAQRQHDDDIRFVLDWCKKMQDTRNETSNSAARRA